MTIDTLAEKMANATCVPGEELWRFLTDHDKNEWRAAASVAISELSSGIDVVIADGFVSDCVLRGCGGYEVSVSSSISIPDKTRVLFLKPAAVQKGGAEHG